MKNEEQEKIDLLCFNLHNSSKSSLFIILTFVTFSFFLIYGYLQELMFKLHGFEKYSWFLTLVQFFFYSCFSYGESYIKQVPERR